MGDGVVEAETNVTEGLAVQFLPVLNLVFLIFEFGIRGIKRGRTVLGEDAPLSLGHEKARHLGGPGRVVGWAGKDGDEGSELRGHGVERVCWWGGENLQPTKQIVVSG